MTVLAFVGIQVPCYRIIPLGEKDEKPLHLTGATCTSSNMALDESALLNNYDLVKLSVFSSHQISARTTTVLAKLDTTPSEGEKPSIVCLRANAKAANKLISIVEIAKRDLTSRGLKCHQYNALSSQLVDIPRKRPVRGGLTDENIHPIEDENEDSGDAFEPLHNEGESLTKKRNVPVMTIYLANAPVRELQFAFG